VVKADTDEARHRALPGDLDQWTWVDSVGMVVCLLMLWMGCLLWAIVALLFFGSGVE
jgi:hypothetical protein